MVRARKNPPDGRANNGGARQGTPGQPYGNRSDLRTQKIAVPKSAEYGQGERLRRSQQAVPLPAAPPVGTPPPAGGAAAPGVWGGPQAGAPGDFLRPTERPDEPLTAGAPFGPGPMGPTQTMGDPVLAQLQAYYQVLPTQDLADLIEDLMMQRGFQ